MKYTKNIILLLCLFIGVSCVTDEQCRKDRYIRMQLGIYHVTYDGTTKIRTATAFSIDSITVKGINKDSLLYNNTKKISSIILPLNKLDTISRYQVTFNSITDTVTILHTNYDTYLSMECGCIKTHKIDSAYSTKHFLDSVSVKTNNVNTSTSAKENIKLYK